jgi:hypothetical protein
MARKAYRDANYEHYRESERAYRREHAEDRRRWDREQRAREISECRFGACQRCGSGLQRGHTRATCNVCWEALAAEKFTAWVAAWVVGDRTAEIAERFGTTPGTVSVSFARLRAGGVPIPRRKKTSRGAVQWADPLPDDPIIVPPGAHGRGARVLASGAQQEPGGGA